MAQGETQVRKRNKKSTEPAATEKKNETRVPQQKKKSGNLAIILIAVVLIVSLSAAGFVFKKEIASAIQKINTPVKSTPVNKQELYNQIIEKQQAHPDDPKLVYEGAKVLASMGQYENALEALKTSWTMTSDDKSQQEFAKSIVDQIKVIHQRQPNLFTLEHSQFVSQVAEASKQPFGFYVAAHGFFQAQLWSNVTELSAKALQLDTTIPLSLKRIIYYQYFAALENSLDFVTLKRVLEPLISTNEWNKDIKLVEFYSTAILRTVNNLKEVPVLAQQLTALRQSFSADKKILHNLCKIDYNIATLRAFRNQHEQVKEIQQKYWNEYRAIELSNVDQDCQTQGKIISKWYEDDEQQSVNGLFIGRSEAPFQPSLRNSEDNQFSSILTDYFNPLHEQELATNTLEHVRVQLSSSRPPILLISDSCNLYEFAGLTESLPPFSIVPTEAEEKETVKVENGVVVHWKATDPATWIVEALPKILHLARNSWLNTPNLKVLLPSSSYARQYLELAEHINIEHRIIWVKQNRVYDVENLLVIDYQLPEEFSKVIQPVVAPVSLLRGAKLDLIGEDFDLSGVNLILIVNPSNSLPTQLIETIENTVGEIDESEQYQVIVLDLYSPLYHQVFAYKRAKIVIGTGAELTNCIWMSKGTSVIEFLPEPLKHTKASVISSQLELHYYPIPESHVTKPQKAIPKLLRDILH